MLLACWTDTVSIFVDVVSCVHHATTDHGATSFHGFCVAAQKGQGMKEDLQTVLDNGKEQLIEDILDGLLPTRCP